MKLLLILVPLFCFLALSNGAVVPIFQCVTFSSDPNTYNATFGYYNFGSTPTSIPKGVLTRNFFTPGPTTYQSQPSLFQPGRNLDVFTLTFNKTSNVTWNLDGSSATATPDVNKICETTSNCTCAPGQQGPPGPKGDTGPIGPQGFNGSEGAQGPEGPAGQNGQQGPQGNQGATGPQGPQGDQGPQGQQGATGPQGQQGFNGSDGAQGPQGPAGTQGPKGDTGQTGPQGPTGDTGAQGPQGPAGSTGPQGPKGDTGLQGPQGFNGSQGPVGPQGPQGQQGPAGPGFDISKCRIVTSDSRTSEEAYERDPNCRTSATATCRPREFLIDGGGKCEGKFYPVMTGSLVDQDRRAHV